MKKIILIGTGLVATYAILVYSGILEKLNRRYEDTRIGKRVDSDIIPDTAWLDI